MSEQWLAELVELEAQASPGPWVKDSLLWLHSEKALGYQNITLLWALRNAFPQILELERTAVGLREEHIEMRGITDDAKAARDEMEHLNEIQADNIRALRQRAETAESDRDKALATISNMLQTFRNAKSMEEIRDFLEMFDASRPH